MLIFGLFNLLQLAVSVHALRFGGAPERVVGGTLLAAAAGTAAEQLLFYNYGRVDVVLLGLDTALLLVLLVIAVSADRYWPTWLAAFQLVSVATHIAKAYDPKIWARVYWLLTANIAWPMLMLLLLGTIRHRGRKLAGLPESAWWWSWRDERAAQGHRRA